MYSNICENVKCSFNPKTKFCIKDKNNKNNDKKKKLFFFNNETGRCIKQNIDNELEDKIIKPNTFEIQNVSFTDISLKEGLVKGFGWTYLKSINKCYPLPPKSQLHYGILNKNKNIIVYNNNFYYYPIEKIENDLIIYLNNYKILIKSLKKCRLISSKSYD